MESDDDICVLQGSPENSEANLHQPIFLFSPLSPETLSDFQQGSIIGLQKGYAELKRRLRETNTKNAELTRKIQELESTKPFAPCSSLAGVGDSFDMMEDAGYSNVLQSGGVAADQLGAEQGYNAKLQRELLHTKMQMEDLQRKYSDTLETITRQMQEMKSQIGTLSQEKAALKQSVDNLQIEKEKALKEGASLQLSLQKANQEVAILKEKQAEISSEPSPEIVADLANMRKVIDSLKSMVLAQRQYLEQRGMSMSMSRSMRGVESNGPSDFPPLSAQGPGSRGSSSSSGGSWEMMNGSTTSPVSRQQQQGSLISITTTTTSVAGRSPKAPLLVSQESANTLPAPSTGSAVSNGSLVAAQNGVRGVGTGAVNGVLKSKTDIIHRRQSDDEIVHGPVKSKTEVIRSHTSPPVLIHSQSSGSGLGLRMGNKNHYTQGVPGQQTSSRSQSQPMPAANQYLQAPVGLNQLVQPRSGARTEGQSSGTLTRGSQRSAVSNAGQQQFQTAYTPARQQSPMAELMSNYDNLTIGSSAVSSANNAVPPSLHIFNQNALAGARVVQSRFTESSSRPGANVVVNPNQLSSGMGRDSPISRGSPQEHIDLTPAPNPTNFELNQFHPIHFENEMSPQFTPNMLDRKCPVCSQDFSHISMDEFQTHVFDCFDDADDTSTAPETLQPQVSPHIVPPVESERICPMCQEKYPGAVSQEFFETHVQSHFEEGDPFEVLGPPRS